MNLNNGIDIYLFQSTGELLFLRRRDMRYLVLSGDFESRDIGHVAMSGIDSKLFKDFEWLPIGSDFSIKWGGVLCASAWRKSGELVVTSPLYVKNIEDYPQIKLSNSPKFGELGEAILGRFEYGREMQAKGENA